MQLPMSGDIMYSYSPGTIYGDRGFFKVHPAAALNPPCHLSPVVSPVFVPTAVTRPYAYHAAGVGQANKLCLTRGAESSGGVCAMRSVWRAVRRVLRLKLHAIVMQIGLEPPSQLASYYIPLALNWHLTTSLHPQAYVSCRFRIR